MGEITHEKRRNIRAENTLSTMKTEIQNKKLPAQNTERKTTQPSVPTLDEIRRRAHEIFMARGGAPGHELEDWLRAEQQLKEEQITFDNSAGR